MFRYVPAKKQLCTANSTLLVQYLLLSRSNWLHPKCTHAELDFGWHPSPHTVPKSANAYNDLFMTEIIKFQHFFTSAMTSYFQVDNMITPFIPSHLNRCWCPLKRTLRASYHYRHFFLQLTELIVVVVTKHLFFRRGQKHCTSKEGPMI